MKMALPQGGTSSMAGSGAGRIMCVCIKKRDKLPTLDSNIIIIGMLADKSASQWKSEQQNIQNDEFLAFFMSIGNHGVSYLALVERRSV